MRRLALALSLAAFCGFAAADDKGTAVKLAGLTGTTPAGWKEETPSNRMRLAQFKLPKAEKDKDDAELAVFVSPGGGGVDANLKRQEAKFELAEGVKKDDAIKVEKLKVGTFDGKLQDISGTFLYKSAPFDPNAKVTKKEGYRQLYVIFEAKDSEVISMTLVGPAATVEKHKKGFEEFLKSFK
jgi:hypothetical protein